MTSYLLPLLAVVALCVLWGVFQLWLRKHHPVDDADRHRCGGCDGSCEE